MFIYGTYYCVVEIINDNKGFFWSVVWLMVTCTETTLNAAGKVRRYSIVFF